MKNNKIKNYINFLVDSGLIALIGAFAFFLVAMLLQSFFSDPIKKIYFTFILFSFAIFGLIVWISIICFKK